MKKSIVINLNLFKIVMKLSKEIRMDLKCKSYAIPDKKLVDFLYYKTIVYGILKV